ncbi:uncharacterized protein LOC121754649 [Salvia splendens]|uniref:uncharacterized protein LOC121754649 n=1 Tax=Salvia splendens TaxID=180675 RepID=UPI001C26F785|nr:uncharacterized protein LOC121754649 [Salvia splendens]
MAKEKLHEENNKNVHLRLLGKRGRDGRTYNLPSVSEVAVLIVGDLDAAFGDRDIIIECKSGKLQRINELYPSYLPLQYPLLFPYDEDGYTYDIPFAKSTGHDSTKFMVHGPCGIVRKSSPCMANGRCTKYFPKKYIAETNFDDDGYPIHRRRDNGRVILKDGVPSDNRFVVPHNRFLLMKYGGHINVEWCNQSRSIKYLFKYINKGYDRVTSFCETGSNGVEKIVDEVSLFYDCRYISSCEAAWRIFGYDIQYKNSAVERSSFHLPNEQYVVFEDSEPLERVVNRNSVRESQFLAWMEANKKFVGGRDLTYVEFPRKFVWNTDHWKLRKQRYSIGRFFYVPPGSGDMYYLRCLLNVIRGATSYEDIKCVNGIQYATFRDACYALGLLDDDKEYIDGITEASLWASAHSIRLLFVSLLLSETLARPDIVWTSCWKYLCEDVVHKQRKILHHPVLVLGDDEIQNLGLLEIEKLLVNG